MCTRTSRWLFTALLSGAIAVWAAEPLWASGQPSAASDEDRLLLGTWTLNLAKSTYRSGPAPRSQIRTYEPHDQGVKATIKTVFIDGRSTTVGYVANYDSLEYAVTGSPEVDTIALKRVAPRTAQATLSHAGKVIATARRVISEDGNTLTISYQGQQMGTRVDYTAVYEKQK
jgi:hypothetical protein